MLQRSTIEAVTTLAVKAAEAGLSIAPLPNTPLAMAIDACYSPILDNVAECDIYQVGEKLHTASTAQHLGGTYPHDEAMAVLTPLVGQTVQKNLQLARTVVNPQVKQVVEAITAELDKANLDSTAPISIVPDYLAGVWASPTLESLVEKYQEAYVKSVRGPNYFGELVAADILNLVKSGSSGFDEDIQNWVSAIGIDFFINVYQDVFAVNSAGDAGIENLRDYMEPAVGGNPVVGRNRALAIFLMARNLKKNAPEGANMSLNEFNEEMSTLMEQSGRVIALSINRRRGDIKRGLLVPFWPAGDVKNALVAGSELVVTGEVYDKFLADGGCPEILLGSYLSDRVANPTDLLTNGERYKTVWNQALMLLKSKAHSERYNSIVRGIMTGVREVIATVAEEDLVVLNRGVLYNRLQEVVSTLTSTECEDHYGVARKVLCYVLYAHTDAEKVLKAIDKIASLYPELDVREAALFATVELMANWLLKLMDVRVGQTQDSQATTQEKANSALATLATAVELGINVIGEIAGNDISNQMNGSEATPAILAAALSLKIQNKLQHLLP